MHYPAHISILTWCWCVFFKMVKPKRGMVLNGDRKLFFPFPSKVFQAVLWFLFLFFGVSRAYMSLNIK